MSGHEDEMEEELFRAERLVDITKAEYHTPGESRFISRLRQLLAAEARPERYRRALADIHALKDSTMKAAGIQPGGSLVDQHKLAFNAGAMLGAAEQALHPTGTAKSDQSKGGKG